MPAGRLRRLVAWERQETVDDGYGNTQGMFVEVFRGHAERTALRGGETVMASRLQGTQPYVLRIRQCVSAWEIRPDWRVRDVHSGRVMQIKSISDVDDRGAYLDILVVEGVAG